MHQLNLRPRVFEPNISPTLHWIGEFGNASVLRDWGSLSLVRDTSADKLTPHTIRCDFLWFPTNAPLFHPATHCVLSSRDVTVDESVYYYRLFPHASSLVPPPPLFLVSTDSTGLAEEDDPAADDTAASRRSPRLKNLPGFLPLSPSPPLQPVVVDCGAAGGGDAGGAGSGGVGSGGTELGAGQHQQLHPQATLSRQQLRNWVVQRGAKPGGAGSGGVEVGVTDSWGADAGGAEPGGVAIGAGGTRGSRAGGIGDGDAGAGGAGAGGAGGSSTGGTVAGGAGGSGVRGTEFGGAGAGGDGGSGAGGTGAGSVGDPGTGGTRAGGTGAGGIGATSAGGTRAGSARREPASRLATLVRTRRAPHVRPPLVPIKRNMAHRSSSVARHPVLPSPQAPTLPDVPNSEFDLARATVLPSCVSWP
ncbi:unnamed protein product [Closterium sp. NIES-54]